MFIIYTVRPISKHFEASKYTFNIFHWNCPAMPSSGMFFSFTALNWCNLVMNELNPVQWVNSKEPAFTWLSCCCYGKEARQGRKNLPPFPFSLSQTPSLFLHSLFSLCQEAWLAGNPVSNESTQLLPSSLHFSNNSVSHLSLQKELFPFSIYLQYFSNPFCLHTPLFPSKYNIKSTSKAWTYQNISKWMCVYQDTELNIISNLNFFFIINMAVNVTHKTVFW